MPWEANLATEKIGLRRLYEAKGFSVSGPGELQFAFPLGGHQVEVYVGHNPKIGIMRISGAGYVVPDKTGPKATFAFGRDALDADNPEPLFVELMCLKSIEVEDSVSAEFRRQKPGAEQPLFEQVKAFTPEIRATLDLVAGVIGLRFHRQLVLVAWAENPVAIRGDEFSYGGFTPVWEMLEPFQLNAKGLRTLRKVLPALDMADPVFKERAASAFGWLLRAWSTTDSLTKFMALFIPIEIVLAGNQGDQQKTATRTRNADRIRSILHKQPVAERNELTSYFQQLLGRQRPSLVERFEELARKAQIPGWESDIEGFKRFNRIRNGVLHHGEQDVQLVVLLDERFPHEVSQLEDIAERYVNWAFFRDSAVYPSRWRPYRAAT